MVFFGVANMVSIVIMMLTFASSVIVPFRKRKDPAYESSLPSPSLERSTLKFFFLMGMIFLFLGRILYSFVTEFREYYTSPSEILQIYITLWSIMFLISVVVTIVHKIMNKDKRDGTYSPMPLCILIIIYILIYFIFVFLLM